jgi:hypothetical protein
MPLGRIASAAAGAPDLRGVRRMGLSCWWREATRALIGSYRHTLHSRHRLGPPKPRALRLALCRRSASLAGDRESRGTEAGHWLAIGRPRLRPTMPWSSPSEVLYYSTMPARCGECTQLWDRYFVANTEEFRAQELLAAASRASTDSTLILDLSARVQSASDTTAVATHELKNHTAMHSRRSSHPVLLISEDESSEA